MKSTVHKLHNFMLMYIFCIFEMYIYIRKLSLYSLARRD